MLKRVSKEMDFLHVFQMSIKDLTPEFLMEFKLQLVITEVLELHSPWLQSILLTAAQTHHASIENMTKKVEHVSCIVVLCTIQPLTPFVGLFCNTFTTFKLALFPQSEMSVFNWILFLQCWDLLQSCQHDLTAGPES